MPRKLFVTTALPYANAPFHIGHMMEYIQADIWVRFHADARRTRSHFVGADDAHGAPIMIAAEKAGKTPQAVRRRDRGRPRAATSTASTSLRPLALDRLGREPRAVAKAIYRALKDERADRDAKTIEQFFDPVKNMFLPDRYIKGECPVCHAKDQYGDSCEVCGSVYSPTELKNPYSALTGATPVLRSSRALLLPAVRPALRSTSCRGWTSGVRQRRRGCSPRCCNKIERMARRQGPTDDAATRRPRRLGHLPRRALLRHRDPRRAGQVLLRLARRAGRLPRLAEELLRLRRGGGRRPSRRLRRVHRRPGGRAGPLHRQGHHLLPHAVLAGDAALLGPQDARPRSTCTASSRSAAARRCARAAAPASRRCATSTSA